MRWGGETKDVAAAGAGPPPVATMKAEWTTRTVLFRLTYISQHAIVEGRGGRGGAVSGGRCGIGSWAEEEHEIGRAHV
jgi:hypothetical protein